MTLIWHKVLAKRDIGHFWDRRSKSTTLCTTPNPLILMPSQSVHFQKCCGREADWSRGVWNGSSEVRCKYWVTDWEGIRMSGFGVVLLSIWTWWGAWVQANIYCGGWIICLGKGGRVAFGARGTKLMSCQEQIR